MAFHTLGCKVNLYETDCMMADCLSYGATVVPFTEDADIYVINTCTVTNVADRKSRQMLHRAITRNPGSIVVATGCYVETAGADRVWDEGVSLVLGNEEKKQFASHLCAYLESRTIPVLTDISQVKTYTPERLSLPGNRTRADVKVQDGCNQFCTYCTIPYARGRIRSKEKEAVLREVELLCERGVKEIVLAGIHLSSYGKDFPSGKENLITLIEALSEIPKLERIRLGSLEPMIVTPEFAERISHIHKLMPHFHLSLQSGCDATLQRMNRHYTAEEYEKSVTYLRKVYDRPAITTDIIAGFPGETEEDFLSSLSFAEKIGFYEMHVFPYSIRKGTVAASLPGQLTASEKEARAGKLIALSHRMSAAYEDSLIGKTVTVLTEEKKEFRGKPCYEGYSGEYVRVMVPQATENNQLVTGILQKENGVFFLG